MARPISTTLLKTACTVAKGSNLLKDAGYLAKAAMTDSVFAARNALGGIAPYVRYVAASVVMDDSSSEPPLVLLGWNVYVSGLGIPLDAKEASVVLAAEHDPIAYGRTVDSLAPYHSLLQKWEGTSEEAESSTSDPVGASLSQLSQDSASLVYTETVPTISALLKSSSPVVPADQGQPMLPDNTEGVDFERESADSFTSSAIRLISIPDRVRVKPLRDPELSGYQCFKRAPSKCVTISEDGLEVAAAPATSHTSYVKRFAVGALPVNKISSYFEVTVLDVGQGDGVVSFGYATMETMTEVKTETLYPSLENDRATRTFASFCPGGEIRSEYPPGTDTSDRPMPSHVLRVGDVIGVLLCDGCVVPVINGNPIAPQNRWYSYYTDPIYPVVILRPGFKLRANFDASPPAGMSFNQQMLVIPGCGGIPRPASHYTTISYAASPHVRTAGASALDAAVGTNLPLLEAHPAAHPASTKFSPESVFFPASPLNDLVLSQIWLARLSALQISEVPNALDVFRIHDCGFFGNSTPLNNLLSAAPSPTRDALTALFQNGSALTDQPLRASGESQVELARYLFVLCRLASLTCSVGDSEGLLDVGQSPNAASRVRQEENEARRWVAQAARFQDNVDVDIVLSRELLKQLSTPAFVSFLVTLVLSGCKRVLSSKGEFIRSPDAGDSTPTVVHALAVRLLTILLPALDPGLVKASVPPYFVPEHGQEEHGSMIPVMSYTPLAYHEPANPFDELAAISIVKPVVRAQHLLDTMFIAIGEAGLPGALLDLMSSSETPKKANPSMPAFANFVPLYRPDSVRCGLLEAQRCEAANAAFAQALVELIHALLGHDTTSGTTVYSVLSNKPRTEWRQCVSEVLVRALLDKQGWGVPPESDNDSSSNENIAPKSSDEIELEELVCGKSVPLDALPQGSQVQASPLRPPTVITMPYRGSHSNVLTRLMPIPITPAVAAYDQNSMYMSSRNDVEQGYGYFHDVTNNSSWFFLMNHCGELIHLPSTDTRSTWKPSSDTLKIATPASVSATWFRYTLQLTPDQRECALAYIAFASRRVMPAERSKSAEKLLAIRRATTAGALCILGAGMNLAGATTAGLGPGLYAIGQKVLIASMAVPGATADSVGNGLEESNKYNPECKLFGPQVRPDGQDGVPTAAIESAAREMLNNDRTAYGRKDSVPAAGKGIVTRCVRPAYVPRVLHAPSINASTARRSVHVLVDDIQRLGLVEYSMLEAFQPAVRLEVQVQALSTSPKLQNIAPKPLFGAQLGDIVCIDASQFYMGQRTLPQKEIQQHMKDLLLPLHLLRKPDEIMEILSGYIRVHLDEINDLSAGLNAMARFAEKYDAASSDRSVVLARAHEIAQRVNPVRRATQAALLRAAFRLLERMLERPVLAERFAKSPANVAMLTRLFREQVQAPMFALPYSVPMHDLQVPLTATLRANSLPDLEVLCEVAEFLIRAGSNYKGVTGALLTGRTEPGLSSQESECVKRRLLQWPLRDIATHDPGRLLDVGQSDEAASRLVHLFANFESQDEYDPLSVLFREAPEFGRFARAYVEAHSLTKEGEKVITEQSLVSEAVLPTPGEGTISGDDADEDSTTRSACENEQDMDTTARNVENGRAEEGKDNSSDEVLSDDDELIARGPSRDSNSDTDSSSSSPSVSNGSRSDSDSDSDSDSSSDSDSDSNSDSDSDSDSHSEQEALLGSWAESLPIKLVGGSSTCSGPELPYVKLNVPVPAANAQVRFHAGLAMEGYIRPSIKSLSYLQNLVEQTLFELGGEHCSPSDIPAGHDKLQPLESLDFPFFDGMSDDQKREAARSFMEETRNKHIIVSQSDEVGSAYARLCNKYGGTQFKVQLSYRADGMLVLRVMESERNIWRYYINSPDLTTALLRNMTKSTDTDYLTQVHVRIEIVSASALDSSSQESNGIQPARRTRILVFVEQKLVFDSDVGTDRVAAGQAALNAYDQETHPLYLFLKKSLVNLENEAFETFIATSPFTYALMRDIGTPVRALYPPVSAEFGSTSQDLDVEMNDNENFLPIYNSFQRRDTRNRHERTEPFDNAYRSLHVDASDLETLHYSLSNGNPIPLPRLLQPGDEQFIKSYAQGSIDPSLAIATNFTRIYAPMDVMYFKVEPMQQKDLEFTANVLGMVGVKCRWTMYQKLARPSLANQSPIHAEASDAEASRESGSTEMELVQTRASEPAVDTDQGDVQTSTSADGTVEDACGSQIAELRYVKPVQLAPEWSLELCKMALLIAECSLPEKPSSPIASPVLTDILTTAFTALMDGRANSLLQRQAAMDRPLLFSEVHAFVQKVKQTTRTSVGEVAPKADAPKTTNASQRTAPIQIPAYAWGLMHSPGPVYEMSVPERGLRLWTVPTVSLSESPTTPRPDDPPYVYHIRRLRPTAMTHEYETNLLKRGLEPPFKLSVVEADSYSAYIKRANEAMDAQRRLGVFVRSVLASLTIAHRNVIIELGRRCLGHVFKAIPLSNIADLQRSTLEQIEQSVTTKLSQENTESKEIENLPSVSVDSTADAQSRPQVEAISIPVEDAQIIDDSSAAEAVPESVLVSGDKGLIASTARKIVQELRKLFVSARAKNPESHIHQLDVSADMGTTLKALKLTLLVESKVWRVMGEQQLIRKSSTMPENGDGQVEDSDANDMCASAAPGLKGLESEADDEEEDHSESPALGTQNIRQREEDEDDDRHSTNTSFDGMTPDRDAADMSHSNEESDVPLEEESDNNSDLIPVLRQTCDQFSEAPHSRSSFWSRARSRSRSRSRSRTRSRCRPRSVSPDSSPAISRSASRSRWGLWDDEQRERDRDRDGETSRGSDSESEPGMFQFSRSSTPTQHDLQPATFWRSDADAPRLLLPLDYSPICNDPAFPVQRRKYNATRANLQSSSRVTYCRGDLTQSMPIDVDEYDTYRDFGPDEDDDYYTAGRCFIGAQIVERVPYAPCDAYPTLTPSHTWSMNVTGSPQEGLYSVRLITHSLLRSASQYGLARVACGKSIAVPSNNCYLVPPEERRFGTVDRTAETRAGTQESRTGITSQSMTSTTVAGSELDPRTKVNHFKELLPANTDPYAVRAFVVSVLLDVAACLSADECMFLFTRVLAPQLFADMIEDIHLQALLDRASEVPKFGRFESKPKVLTSSEAAYLLGLKRLVYAIATRQRLWLLHKSALRAMWAGMRHGVMNVNHNAGRNKPLEAGMFGLRERVAMDIILLGHMVGADAALEEGDLLYSQIPSQWKCVDISSVSFVSPNIESIPKDQDQCALDESCAPPSEQVDSDGLAQKSSEFNDKSDDDDDASRNADTSLNDLCPPELVIKSMRRTKLNTANAAFNPRLANTAPRLPTLKDDGSYTFTHPAFADALLEVGIDMEITCTRKPDIAESTTENSTTQAYPRAVAEQPYSSLAFTNLFSQFTSAPSVFSSYASYPSGSKAWAAYSFEEVDGNALAPDLQVVLAVNALQFMQGVAGLDPSSDFRRRYHSALNSVGAALADRVTYIQSGLLDDVMNNLLASPPIDTSSNALSNLPRDELRQYLNRVLTVKALMRDHVNGSTNLPLPPHLARRVLAAWQAKLSLLPARPFLVRHYSSLLQGRATGNTESYRNVAIGCHVLTSSRIPYPLELTPTGYNPNVSAYEPQAAVLGQPLSQERLADIFAPEAEVIARSIPPYLLTQGAAVVDGLGVHNPLYGAVTGYQQDPFIDVDLGATTRIDKLQVRLRRPMFIPRDATQPRETISPSSLTVQTSVPRSWLDLLLAGESSLEALEPLPHEDRTEPGADSDGDSYNGSWANSDSSDEAAEAEETESSTSAEDTPVQESVPEPKAPLIQFIEAYLFSSRHHSAFVTTLYTSQGFLVAQPAPPGSPDAQSGTDLVIALPRPPVTLAAFWTFVRCYNYHEQYDSLEPRHSSRHWAIRNLLTGRYLTVRENDMAVICRAPVVEPYSADHRNARARQASERANYYVHQDVAPRFGPGHDDTDPYEFTTTEALWSYSSGVSSPPLVIATDPITCQYPPNLEPFVFIIDEASSFLVRHWSTGCLITTHVPETATAREMRLGPIRDLARNLAHRAIDAGHFDGSEASSQSQVSASMLPLDINPNTSALSITQTLLHEVDSNMTSWSSSDAHYNTFRITLPGVRELPFNGNRVWARTADSLTPNYLQPAADGIPMSSWSGEGAWGMGCARIHCMCIDKYDRGAVSRFLKAVQKMKEVMGIWELTDGRMSSALLFMTTGALEIAKQRVADRLKGDTTTTDLEYMAATLEEATTIINERVESVAVHADAATGAPDIVEQEVKVPSSIELSVAPEATDTKNDLVPQEDSMCSAAKPKAIWIMVTHQILSCHQFDGEPSDGAPKITASTLNRARELSEFAIRVPLPELDVLSPAEFDRLLTVGRLPRAKSKSNASSSKASSAPWCDSDDDDDDSDSFSEDGMESDSCLSGAEFAADKVEGSTQDILGSYPLPLPDDDLDDRVLTSKSLLDDFPIAPKLPQSPTATVTSAYLTIGQIRATARAAMPVLVSPVTVYPGVRIDRDGAITVDFSEIHKAVADEVKKRTNTPANEDEELSMLITGDNEDVSLFSQVNQAQKKLGNEGGQPNALGIVPYVMGRTVRVMLEGEGHLAVDQIIVQRARKRSVLVSPKIKQDIEAEVDAEFDSMKQIPSEVWDDGAEESPSVVDGKEELSEGTFAEEDEYEDIERNDGTKVTRRRRELSASERLTRNLETLKEVRKTTRHILHHAYLHHVSTQLREEGNIVTKYLNPSRKWLEKYKPDLRYADVYDPIEEDPGISLYAFHLLLATLPSQAWVQLARYVSEHTADQEVWYFKLGLKCATLRELLRVRPGSKHDTAAYKVTRDRMPELFSVPFDAPWLQLILDAYYILGVASFDPLTRAAGLWSDTEDSVLTEILLAMKQFAPSEWRVGLVCGPSKYVSTPTLQFDMLTAQEQYERKLVDHKAKYTIFGQIFQHIASGMLSMKILRSGHDRMFSAKLIGYSAIDAGGPYREILSQIGRDLMSPLVPLFIQTPNNRSQTGQCREAYIPNPACTNDFHMQQYEVVGKLIGAVLPSSDVLELHFPPLVWKRLASERLTWQDLIAVDQTLGRILTQCYQQVRTDPEECKQQVDNFNTYAEENDLTFSVCDFTSASVDLIPNGSEVRLRWENRLQYANALVRYLLSSIDKQLDAIARGFFTIIPRTGARLLASSEIETMVTGRGMTRDQAERLKKRSSYSHPYHANHRTIQMFWDMVLNRFDDGLRSQLLKFASGRSRLSANDRGLTIEPLYCTENPDNYYPAGHTCFFSIDVPEYTTIDAMYNKFYEALTSAIPIDADGNDANTGTRIQRDEDE